MNNMIALSVLINITFLKKGWGWDEKSSNDDNIGNGICMMFTTVTFVVDHDDTDITTGDRIQYMCQHLLSSIMIRVLPKTNWKVKLYNIHLHFTRRQLCGIVVGNSYSYLWAWVCENSACKWQISGICLWRLKVHKALMRTDCRWIFLHVVRWYDNVNKWYSCDWWRVIEILSYPMLQNK